MPSCQFPGDGHSSPIDVSMPLIALRQPSSLVPLRFYLQVERPPHHLAGDKQRAAIAPAFANNLKKYSKTAGFDPLHLQTRHTYARIVAEESGSYQETQEALDH